MQGAIAESSSETHQLDENTWNIIVYCLIAMGFASGSPHPTVNWPVFEIALWESVLFMFHEWYLLSHFLITIDDSFDAEMSAAQIDVATQQSRELIETVIANGVLYQL